MRSQVTAHGSTFCLFHPLANGEPAFGQIGENRAPISNRHFQTGRRVDRCLALDLGVQQRTTQNAICGQKKPHQENDDSGQRPIRGVVVADISYIERKSERDCDPE